MDFWPSIASRQGHFSKMREYYSTPYFNLQVKLMFFILNFMGIYKIEKNFKKAFQVYI